MTSETDPSVDTPESFRAALEEVMTEAQRQGVALEGGWLIETDSDGPNLDVEIWPVDSQSSTE